MHSGFLICHLLLVVKRLLYEVKFLINEELWDEKIINSLIPVSQSLVKGVFHEKERIEQPISVPVYNYCIV
jgi:hypothetical protein